jgi:predicted Zn-dependent protease
MFLKFSRDDETQADELGLRYMGRENYDPNEMVEVMAMLDGVSKSAGGGRVPEWLATHPNPGNRKEHIEGLIGTQGDAYAGSRVYRERYLEHIDGLVFGQNPREGFFRENTFYHPEMKFRFDFPQGWEKTNMKQGVVGISGAQDAIIQITLSDQPSIESAAQQFFSQQDIAAGDRRTGEINGLPALSGEFSVSTEQGVLRGRVTYVSYGSRVYQLLGYSTEQNWPAYVPVVDSSVRSFRELTDPAILAVQPLRLEIVTLDGPMTFEEFTRRYPSSVSAETLLLINRADLYDRFDEGTMLKRVVGESVAG